MPDQYPIQKPVHNAPADTSGEWIVEPFLHHESRRIYNPLTDLDLDRESATAALLAGLAEGSMQPSALDSSDLQNLIDYGWLVDQRNADGKRFFLKYVSIETFSPCNQACDFCPVSVSPRPRSLMEQSQFEDILDQLKPYQSTIKGVFLNFYNEPTIDPLFLERVASLHDRGLAIALLSNGSALTPKKVDALLALGGIGFLSVNLSTLDRDAYKAQRGKDHLRTVMRNLHYLKNLSLADQMVINVMGYGDEAHKENTRQIKAALGESRLEIKPFVINDRCGSLPMGKDIHIDQALGGCEQTGSRPLQHLHITATGLCVLCCQDYYEKQVLGDTSKEPLEKILRGEKFEKARNMAYGLAESGQDFLCRKCEYALRRPVSR